MSQSQLSYRALQAKVQAVPAGPSAYLSTPRWKQVCNVIGLLGIAAGLIPSLVILAWEPRDWMVDVARTGLFAVAVGWIPVIVRDTWAITRSITRWEREQAEQLDHDFAEWHRLCEWVATHPRAHLEQHLRWLRMSRERLTGKLQFFGGGIDRIGVLPALVALAVQVRLVAEGPDVPRWQLALALFAGGTYLVALVGSAMRLRLQLYEMAVSEALERFDGDKSV